MNEKELFDALAKDCPNELAKHDAKVRADAIEEFVRTLEKRQTFGNNEFEMGLDFTDVIEVAEQLKEQKNDIRN